MGKQGRGGAVREVGFGYGEATKRLVTIDVSPFGAAVGFTLPINVSANVWNTCVALPDDCPEQDPMERLLTLLEAFADAAGERSGEGEVMFEVPVRNDDGDAKPIELKGICGSLASRGDLRPEELVLLITFPWEQ